MVLPGAGRVGVKNWLSALTDFVFSHEWCYHPAAPLPLVVLLFAFESFTGLKVTPGGEVPVVGTQPAST
eukprot:11169549-Alexandrium_andersonii.AAC.1